MGYILTQGVANITQPYLLSLASDPNFLTVDSVTPVSEFPLELNIDVHAFTTGVAATVSALSITGVDGSVHAFVGTTNIGEVSGNTYLLTADEANNAENLINALLSDSWIRANYEVVSVYGTGSLGEPTRSGRINMRSKAGASAYNFDIAVGSLYDLTWIQQNSTNTDAITNGDENALIFVEFYKDPSVFFGSDYPPITPDKLGKLSTVLNKTYTEGKTSFFDLNALVRQSNPYKFSTNTVAGWFNPSTVSAYRAVVKRQINGQTQSLFISDACFALNGHSTDGNGSDTAGHGAHTSALNNYVLVFGGVCTLLTNKPLTPLHAGQLEYLNFFFYDPERGSGDPTDYSYSLRFEWYSASGEFLGVDATNYQIQRGDLSQVNTCVFNAIQILRGGENAGLTNVARCKVYLEQGSFGSSSISSNALYYEVRPDCLFESKVFSFLNRLGGWDSFNFEAVEKEDIKPNFDTFSQTITPITARDIFAPVEAVNSSNIAQTYTVESAPITTAVAEWLKELASSRAVFDEKGDYIIIEDFTLSISGTADMQRATIKYHKSKNDTNG